MKPLLITIPHSGEKVPPQTPWLLTLPETTLMCDVDRFVDRLYEPALSVVKIPYVKTEWHRYAADLNRFPEDVDSSSVEGNTTAAGTHNRGFHWTITTTSLPLMTAPMSLKNHQELVKLIYDPFHLNIRNEYKKIKDKGFSEVYHIDAHSMPSVGTKMHRDPGERRADIVISDCSGKSCKWGFRDLVIAAYCTAGFKVAYNWPYGGGRVTEQYGHPEQGHHAIQVELNRDLYMDEVSKKLKPSHAQVQEKIKLALQYIYDQL